MVNEAYQRKGWEERIERLKGDIAFREAVGHRQSGISDQHLKEIKEELRELTTPPEQRIAETEARIVEMNKGSFVFDGHRYEAIKAANRDIEDAEREISGEKPKPVSQVPPLLSRPTVLQGGIRPPVQGLHTPTMAERMAQANQADPTQPYFDTNSDHMRMIDPLAEHIIFSGEGVKTVNPLKPGPKIGGGPS